MDSFVEKMQHLVTGYISIHIGIDQNNKYPLELITVIVQFLGHIAMKFDLIYKEYRNCIHNHDTLIKKQTSQNNRVQNA